MISNLHKSKRYKMIAKNLEVSVSDADISGLSFASIDCIDINDRVYSLPNSIRTGMSTTTSRLSHLSAKEPELDEKSIQELLDFIGKQ